MTDYVLDHLKSLREEYGNLYSEDADLCHAITTLYSYKTGSLEKRLTDFAEKVWYWDSLIETTQENHAQPFIKTHASLGERIDEIIIPPQVHQVRKELVNSGILEKQSSLEKYTKVYLLSHIGEAGVVCPLACTEGLIKVIQETNSPFLQEQILPSLYSLERPLAGAQFITEKDAGSDIGAIKTQAVQTGREREYKISGHKWFCSAADQHFLVAAKTPGASEGTDGVSIFYVPRTTNSGNLNHMTVERLKDKMGTKLLPTVEITFDGSEAFLIGEEEKGFKNLMNYVINTSRIMNAAASCGIMGRAYKEAKHYASQRSTFGKPLENHPLINEQLQTMESSFYAKRALFLHLLARMDTHSIKETTEAHWQRLLINLTKYRTSQGAFAVSNEARRILGGNGVICDFSIIPRLCEDAAVLETWEGTYNVLALQICKDALKFGNEGLSLFRKTLDGYFKEQVKKQSRDLPFPIWKSILGDWYTTYIMIPNMQKERWIEDNACSFADKLGGLLESTLYASLIAQTPDEELKQYQTQLLQHHYKNIRHEWKL